MHWYNRRCYRNGITAILKGYFVYLKTKEFQIINNVLVGHIASKYTEYLIHYFKNVDYKNIHKVIRKELKEYFDSLRASRIIELEKELKFLKGEQHGS